MKRLLAICLLALGCAPRPVPAPPLPPPPPAAQPRMEASLISQPGPAQVSLDGQPLGQTPRVVRVESLDEVFRITAAQDKEQPSETRIRVISETSMEVTFLFRGSVSPMAKALGLPRILVFDYGSALTFQVNHHDLAPSFTPMLDSQAALLTSHFPGIPVFVCGHTDPSGSASHNAILAFQRAEVVAAYLVQHGVDRKLIKTQGFGSTYPVAGNDTPEGRALNRRTEIILPR